MKSMSGLCRRIIGMLRLGLIKIINGKQLILRSGLKACNLSPDTEIRIGCGGTIDLDAVGMASNVHLSAWKGKIQIGKGCKLNRNDIIVSHSAIRIGDGTILGPNVCIYDHDHAFGANGVIAGEFRCGEVVIGNNVWIGAGVIVLRGSIIGDGCVIGAGCVVSGEIPARSLVTAANRELRIEPLCGS